MCRVQNGIEYLNERIFFLFVAVSSFVEDSRIMLSNSKKGKKVKKTIGNVRFFLLFFSLVSSKSLATRCVPNWQSLSSEWWWQPFCYSRRRWIINLKAIDNLKVWTGEKKKSRRKSRIQNSANSWTRKPNQRSKTTETTVLFFVACCVRSAAQHGRERADHPVVES